MRHMRINVHGNLSVCINALLCKTTKNGKTVICLSVWRAKAFPLKNSILFSVPWLSRAFVCPASFGRFFWLLTWLAKLMLICVKPSDWVIMAILKRCLNVFMVQIWNCLEVCCIPPTVLTSYSPIKIYANQTPHFSLWFCSPLLPL